MKNRSNVQYKVGFPGILYAGCDSLDNIHVIVEENKAKNMLIFIDGAVKELPLLQNIFKDLDSKIVKIIDNVQPEPTIESVEEIFNVVKNENVDLICAIGGGSVMDMSKIIAAGLNNPAFAESKFTNTELIQFNSVTTIMIPTTAGTGAEATPNAIFLFTDKELKIGLVSNKMVASYVILEPRLTLGLPKHLTAYTGIDALCHAVESYISTMANPVSKVFSLKAAQLLVNNIEKAYEDGMNIEFRENMLLGSFFAGMCLFSSTTVAVHALSYPLGGKYHIPHGVSNAILLPSILEVNLSECKKEYIELANVILPEDIIHSALDVPSAFVAYITDLCRKLQIPEKLTSFGVKEEDVDFLTDNAMEVKRLLDRNPKKLTKEEIKMIYRKLV